MAASVRSILVFALCLACARAPLGQQAATQPAASPKGAPAVEFVDVTRAAGIRW